MTNEERQLLLKDICARLPYRTIVHIEVLDENHAMTIGGSGDDELDMVWITTVQYENPYHIIKPYLRPLSSMTGKEADEWHKTTFGQRWITFDNVERCADWLNAHHFDYRGLIEKGLAIEAPEGMYKTE